MGGEKKKKMTTLARRLRALKTICKKKEEGKRQAETHIEGSQTQWIRRVKVKAVTNEGGSSSRCIISNDCLLQIANATCEHAKQCQMAAFGDLNFLNGNVELSCTFCKTLFVISIDSGKLVQLNVVLFSYLYSL